MKVADLLPRSAREVSIDPAGQDGINLNVVRRPRAGERSRELYQTTLARGISGDTRRAEQLIHRADIEDLAAAGRFHMRIGGLRAKEGGAEINVQNLVPLLFGDLFRGLSSVHSGVVDENVAAAEIPDHGFDQFAA